MIPGFKASASFNENGLSLVIDNVSKFMSTTSCLERINEIKEKCKGDYKKIVKDEFIGKSIIANWGYKKAYIVKNVIFDKNPFNLSFEYGSTKMSVAEYF